MGVNNISHFNYSHTATPIHQQPSSNPPPSLSSSLHFPSVFTPKLFFAYSQWLDYTFYLLSPTHFLFLSILGEARFLFSSDYTEFKLLVSGLESQAWGLSLRRMEGIKGCGSKILQMTVHKHFVWCVCLNAATTANSNNNSGKFLELSSADYERDTISGSADGPLMQQKPLKAAECIVNHVSCFQELDVLPLAVLDLQAAPSPSLFFSPPFSKKIPGELS